MSKNPDDLHARHLARVVESSQDAIVSKDLNGVIISWNRAAERMFGYTAHETVGRSIRLIIPDDRQSEEDMVLSRIRSGQSVTNFETMRRRKDGTLLPISLTVSPVLDDDGTVIGASKVARDITDRVQAEIASRRLAAVVESSDDAIVTKDLSSTITTWNPAAERMFGYSTAEAIGRSIRMIIPAELQQEEDEVLRRIRAGEKVDHYETVRQRKDGSRVAISLTISPIRNARGEIVGASKIARDITERARLRQLEREHAEQVERLGEVGALVASTLDRDVVVQRVTDIATERTGADFGAFYSSVIDPQAGEVYQLITLSGAERDAMGGLPNLRVNEIFALDDEVPVRLDDVSADGRFAANASHYGIPASGPPVRSYLAVPVKGRGGRLIGALVFGHARPAAFTEFHEQFAMGIAAWASMALENSRLYSEAQTANRVKDEFLAVLSHELRTPLNAIVGYSRLLRGRILAGEKAERALETLERNANWLTQIVEDVLDVSRIVAGKIRLDVQPVELALIVDNAVATVQPAADAKRIRVQTTLDPRVGPVSGDPGRLQQVVWNLMSNAVKFTPKSGRVQVVLQRVNSHVEIVVSDTGIGIPSDFLPHVFERFRQADGATTRKTGGLGLGLAIVKNIVEMHGGTVEASSAGEGQGSTFRVLLPLMAVQPDAIAAVRQHPRTQRTEPLHDLADLHGVRVVAVDDEEDALTLLRVVLETAGAEVSTVSAPQKAVEHIRAMKPHVIVVDLGMPEIDGFEVIRRLRECGDPAVADVPAAALTAFARSDDRTKALRSGFEMHLAKPVDPGELVASVATLARRSRGRANRV